MFSVTSLINTMICCPVKILFGIEIYDETKAILLYKSSKKKIKLILRLFLEHSKYATIVLNQTK